MKKKSIALAISAFTSTLLIGCSGSSSSSSNEGVTSSLSGKVADGYIVGAKVCGDLNDNGVCDTGEPTATTDNSGSYSITIPAGKSAKQIIVTAPPSAIDLDTGKSIGGQGLVFKAPVEAAKFISPVSSIIKDKMSQSNIDYQQALKQVATELGVTNPAHLEEDFVAGGATNPDLADLHKKVVAIATVAKKRLADYVASRPNSTFTEKDKEKLAELVQSDIVKVLSSIKAIAEDQAKTIDDLRDENSAAFSSVSLGQLKPINFTLEGDKSSDKDKDKEGNNKQSYAYRFASKCFQNSNDSSIYYRDLYSFTKPDDSTGKGEMKRSLTIWSSQTSNNPQQDCVSLNLDKAAPSVGLPALGTFYYSIASADDFKTGKATKLSIAVQPKYAFSQLYNYFTIQSDLNGHICFGPNEGHYEPGVKPPSSDSSLRTGEGSSYSFLALAGKSFPITDSETVDFTTYDRCLVPIPAN